MQFIFYRNKMIQLTGEYILCGSFNTENWLADTVDELADIVGAHQTNGSTFSACALRTNWELNVGRRGAQSTNRFRRVSMTEFRSRSINIIQVSRSNYRDKFDCPSNSTKNGSPTSRLPISQTFLIWFSLSLFSSNIRLLDLSINTPEVTGFTFEANKSRIQLYRMFQFESRDIST